MVEKLKKYLANKNLEELASLRALVASICNDYDKNLTNYAIKVKNAPLN
jgi:predicted house-cleaning noncanonical NTP pyrophosphatase (MazG superfamily)